MLHVTRNQLDSCYLAIPEKKNGNFENIHTFLKPPPQNFSIFFTLPWKFQTKQSSTPGNSTRLCQIPWKFQGQKRRPLEIPHYFFLVTFGNLTSFLINPWKFYMLHPWKSHILKSCFFWNRPFAVVFLEFYQLGS